MAKVKVFYIDGKNPDSSDHVSAKSGELLQITDIFISIKNDYGQDVSFPLNKVIRWEALP